MSNNKKAFLLGFVFMALSVFGVAEAAPELSAGTVSGAPGEQVTVPVNYTSDGTVAALQFDIQYNPSQLTMADPVASPAIGIHIVHSSEPSAGVRRILIVPPESNLVLDSGLLLDIPVTINSAASYQSETLTITAVVMSDSSAMAVAPTAVTDGVVNIESSNPVTITTTTLLGGIVGQPYSQTLAAIDGVSPYSWSITSGALPTGLSLDTSTGQISGAPITAGTTNFTAQAEDSIGLTATQALSLEIVDLAATGSVSIVWTDLVGVTADGSTLTKTEANGWGNSGAASVQVIAGDGAVEFEAVATNTYRMVGLSSSNASAHWDTIDYTIFMRDNGTLRVYEDGTNRGDFGAYQSGDILRVERIGSTVVYKQNGTVFYTSAAPSTGSLIADAALYDVGAKIENARIYEAP